MSFITDSPVYYYKGRFFVLTIRTVSLINVNSYCQCYICESRRGFGLDIEFTDHLQVVITNNYNTIAISTLYKSKLSISSPQCLHY
jgi:hypothetical protein